MRTFLGNNRTKNNKFISLQPKCKSEQEQGINGNCQSRIDAPLTARWASTINFLGFQGGAYSNKHGNSSTEIE